MLNNFGEFIHLKINVEKSSLALHHPFVLLSLEVSVVRKKIKN